jgi:isopenicillin N synthase-like dioxygenase
MEEEIPISDLGPFLSGWPGRSSASPRKVRCALENVGFFYVRNHGVPEKIVERVLAENVRFHPLPLERKMRVQGRSDRRSAETAREDKSRADFANAQPIYESGSTPSFLGGYRTVVAPARYVLVRRSRSILCANPGSTEALKHAAWKRCVAAQPGGIR